LIHGDILDATADGLILTIDGAHKGMEGNLARAYARRWPDAYEEVAYEIPYPLALGRTIAAFPDAENPFRLVLVASTLHHADILDEGQKAAVVSNALREAIALAQRHRVQRLATAVMSGGWRLPFISALNVMLTVARPLSMQKLGMKLEIYIRDEADYLSALEHAESICFPLVST
jgi:O-acetyl-ADP-ribose deacetylase (regulator of RNase III)